jgi:hypothetical protein
LSLSNSIPVLQNQLVERIQLLEGFWGQYACMVSYEPVLGQRYWFRMWSLFPCDAARRGPLRDQLDAKDRLHRCIDCADVALTDDEKFFDPLQPQQIDLHKYQRV